jgi:hypothetical protein
MIILFYREEAMRERPHPSSCAAPEAEGVANGVIELR